MISSVENTQPSGFVPQQNRWQRSDGARNGENSDTNRETSSEQPEELQNGGQSNGENRAPPPYYSNSFNSSNQRNLDQLVNVPTLYYGAYMKQWVFNLRCFAASIGYEMKTVFYLPKCINNALHQNAFMEGVSLFYNPQIHDHFPGWPLNTSSIQPTKFLPAAQVNAELPMAHLKDMYNNMHANVATLHRITNPYHVKNTNDLQLVVYWRAAQIYDELVQHTRTIGLARNCQEFAKMDESENVKKPVIFYHRLFPIMVADELPYIPPPTPHFFANHFLPSLGLNTRRPRMQTYVHPSQIQQFAMPQQFQPIPQLIPDLGPQQFTQHPNLAPNHQFVPPQIQPGPIPVQVQEFAPQGHPQPPHSMNFVPQNQGQPQVPEFVPRHHQHVQGNGFVQQQLPRQPNEEQGTRTSPYNGGSSSATPPQYLPQQELGKVPPMTQHQQPYPHSHPKFINHNYHQNGHAQPPYPHYGQFNPSNEQAYHDENVAPNQPPPQYLPTCQYPPNVIPQHASFPISQSPQNSSSLGNSPPSAYSLAQTPPNSQIPRLNQVQHGQLYYHPEQYQQPLCQAMEQVRV